MSKIIAIKVQRDYRDIFVKYLISGCIVDSSASVSRVDDDAAEFWTLYERDTDGLSQALCDFTDKGSAERAKQAFTERDILKRFVEQECFVQTGNGFDYATVAMPQDSKGGAL